MKSIFETAREDDRLSTSLRIVQVGEMVPLLDEVGEYTAFFPTNEAFSRFPAEVLHAVMVDRERLTSLIKYHVVQGKLTVQELAQMEAIRTLQGDHLEIEGGQEMVKVNDAAIIQANVDCTNGMYHVIDQVLLPRAVEARVTR